MEIEEEICTDEPSFFSKPHLRMFRVDPAEDDEFQFDLDEVTPQIPDIQKEIEQSMFFLDKSMEEIRVPLNPFFGASIRITNL